MIKRFLLLILLVAPLIYSHAQDLPVGGWRDCLPYNNGTDVVLGNGKVYCITSLDIFSITLSENSIQEYSKVTGLSDIGISTAAYDSALHVLVIGYTNSNIDLLYDNGTVINVPAIKQAPIIGNRNINSIYFIGSEAYLSCGFGIVNLSLTTQLIDGPTYYIGSNGASIQVNAICLHSDTIYAATGSKAGINGGVYYNLLSDSFDFPNYASWTLYQPSSGLPAGADSFIVSYNNRVYAEQHNILYELRNNKWVSVYNEPGWLINGVTVSSNNIVMAEQYGVNNAQNKVELVNASNTAIALTPGVGLPTQAVQDNNGNLWVSDIYNGLIFYNAETKVSTSVTPNCPYTAGDVAVAANNGSVYVAPDPLCGCGTINGFFVRNNNKWSNYNIHNSGWLNNVNDLSSVAISPVGNTVYFGSFGTGGLLQFTFPNTYQFFNLINSSLGQQLGNVTGTVNVSGLAFDNENNLWVSNLGAAAPVSVYQPSTNSWQAFPIPSSLDNGRNFIRQIVVDQFDQKWIDDQLGGLLVMSSGFTPSAVTYRVLGTGVGNGNLPTADVTSMVVDQLGNVWVGTTQGVTVFYCPGDELTSAGCDAQQPIYSTSSGNGYLLGTDEINAIIIDGANRKWVGTNTGLYLLSADGSKEIENFNATNSPLFSNNVISLALDPISGDLYIGTDQGMLEYRTNSNEGSQTSCTVNVFPNPVKQNYTGPITIGGLVANATVKITDVTGSMIYETTALGGEATWNGNTQNGVRAKTGVYLVFVSNNDGSVTCTGKFLLIN